MICLYSKRIVHNVHCLWTGGPGTVGHVEKCVELAVLEGAARLHNERHQVPCFKCNDHRGADGQSAKFNMRFKTS